MTLKGMSGALLCALCYQWLLSNVHRPEMLAPTSLIELTVVPNFVLRLFIRFLYVLMVLVRP